MCLRAFLEHCNLSQLQPLGNIILNFLRIEAKLWAQEAEMIISPDYTRDS